MADRHFSPLHQLPDRCRERDHRRCRSDNGNPTAEVFCAKRMIERSMERFNLYPAKLMGDSAYGSASMLGWLVHEHGIEPHVTVFDRRPRTDGTFSRGDFTYDHERDIYVCPGDNSLTTTGTRVNDGTTVLYRASKHDCAGLLP